MSLLSRHILFRALRFGLFGSRLSIVYAGSPFTWAGGSAISTASPTVAGDIPATGAYAVTSGTLPTGISLNADNGDLTGTPSVDAVSSAVITVTDTAGRTARATVEWTIVTLPIGFFTNAGYAANEWV
jgi:hypothetical protein